MLAYKIGAVVGRSLEMRTGIDFAYYRSKVWKDVYDVVSLSSLEIDEHRFRKFLSESNLDSHRHEIIQIIEDNFTDETRSLLKGLDLGRIREVLGV